MDKLIGDVFDSKNFMICWVFGDRWHRLYVNFSIYQNGPA